MPTTPVNSKQKLLAQRAALDEKIRRAEAREKTQAKAQAEAARQKRDAVLLRRLRQEGYGDMNPEVIIDVLKCHLGPGLSHQEREPLATILEERPTLVLVGEDGQPLSLPPEHTEARETDALEPVETSSMQASSNRWFRTREGR